MSEKDATVPAAGTQLIDGAPTSCHRCGKALCLRKQVINLSLGSETQMLCLSCLAGNVGKDEAAFMGQVKNYILSRDCFHKEWKRYESRNACPDPHNCVIEKCFAEE
jgi:hypothetical protein